MYYSRSLRSKVKGKEGGMPVHASPYVCENKQLGENILAAYHNVANMTHSYIGALADKEPCSKGHSHRWGCH